MMAVFNFSARRIPVLGSLLFANPNEEFQRQQFHRAGLAYQAYRPESQQARLNSLAMVTGMAQPLNNLMVQSYGPSAQIPFRQAYQNPMSPGGTMIGAPAQAQPQSGQDYPYVGTYGMRVGR